jgi:hypothetical protein
MSIGQSWGTCAGGAAAEPHETARQRACSWVGPRGSPAPDEHAWQCRIGEWLGGSPSDLEAVGRSCTDAGVYVNDGRKVECGHRHAWYLVNHPSGRRAGEQPVFQGARQERRNAMKIVDRGGDTQARCEGGWPAGLPFRRAHLQHGVPGTAWQQGN